MRAVAGLAAIVLAMAVTPIAWRAVIARWAPPASSAPPSYLPAIQGPRERHPFDATPVEDLRRMQFDYVIIGDSMGGRVDPAYFTQISDRGVAPLLQNATGSAHWFLVFKNWVVASGTRPRYVTIFFRDANLTDPMWRLSMSGLDQVATDREDELNRVVGLRTQGAWFQVHAAAEKAYAVDRTRGWVEPALTEWVARTVAGRQHRQQFVDQMNEAFGLDHLRPMAAADLAAAEDRDLDFQATVGTSLIPEFLRLADAHGLRLCFVRVLRRPHDGQPPDESPRLTRYVADLRQYLRSHGAVLFDDRDIPELARLAYNDGDHIAREARKRYTELFWSRLAALPD